MFQNVLKVHSLNSEQDFARNRGRYTIEPKIVGRGGMVFNRPKTRG